MRTILSTWLILFTLCSVIDFGSSCYEHERVYTYIQSRFYRAPEVILGSNYGMPIDMWSLGCILVELATGFPLLPGEDEADQLACMIELLGMPPPHLLGSAKRSRQFVSSKGFPRYCTVTTKADGSIVLNGGFSRKGKERGLPGSRDLKQVLKNCNDPYFLDFIHRCLMWDPEQRMTPGKALKHVWLHRRLPQLPKKPNEALPALSATSTPPTFASVLRTSASSSKSSTKSNTLQSNITESTTKAKQLNDLMSSIYAALQRSDGERGRDRGRGQPQVSANHQPTTGSHPSLNSVSGDASSGGSGGGGGGGDGGVSGGGGGDGSSNNTSTTCSSNNSNGSSNISRSSSTAVINCK